MRQADHDRLHHLLRVQRGYVRRSQLVDLGLAYSTIRRHVADGRLIVVGPTTYRHGAVAPTWLGQVGAACLEVGGIASHLTAAQLHGLLPGQAPIHVTVPKAANGSTRPSQIDGVGLVVHGSTSVPIEDRFEVAGVPCTSAARTLLGVAALVPQWVSSTELKELVASSWDRRLTSEAWLWWMLERRRRQGRNGVLALEEAIVAVSGMGVTESWLERAFLALVDEVGLPRPSTQRRVERTGRFVARVDFWFAGSSLVVEALGYRFHRTREQLAADLRRANEIQLAGNRILQFSYDDLVRAPGRAMAQLRDALGLAA